MYRFCIHPHRSFLTICLAVATTVFAGSTVPAQGQTGVINPLNYAGANLCVKIQAAIAANAGANPQGLVIDARSARPNSTRVESGP